MVRTHTLEQVRKQLEVVKGRLEETKIQWRQLKEDFALAKAAGDKDRQKEIAKEMDKMENVRTGLKSDLYALMAEEKEMVEESNSPGPVPGPAGAA